MARRPDRSRALVLLCLAVVGSSLVVAAPAEARSPGAPVPSLSGKVIDSCTRAKVGGLVVTAALPGVGTIMPSFTGKGTFVFQDLAPGSYRLSVSAPGYAPLADDSGTGVTVTLPAVADSTPGTTVRSGLTGAISLVPISPGSDCKPPRSSPIKGMVGTVRDASSGAPVSGISVSIVDPATSQKPPGPGCKATIGKFVQKQLPPGTWSLALSAPGYLGFAGLPVTIASTPEPVVGTISLGAELAVTLPATG